MRDARWAEGTASTSTTVWRRDHACRLRPDPRRPRAHPRARVRIGLRARARRAARAADRAPGRSALARRNGAALHSRGAALHCATLVLAGRGARAGGLAGRRFHRVGRRALRHARERRPPRGRDLRRLCLGSIWPARRVPSARTRLARAARQRPSAAEHHRGRPLRAATARPALPPLRRRRRHAPRARSPRAAERAHPQLRRGALDALGGRAAQLLRPINGPRGPEHHLSIAFHEKAPPGQLLQ